MHASSFIYSIFSNLNFGASFGWQGAQVILAHASYGPCYSVPCMHASSCIYSILSNLNFGASFGWQGAQVILAHASYGPCYSVPCMHASSCIYSILSNLNFGASFGWQGAHTFDGMCLYKWIQLWPSHAFHTFPLPASARPHRMSRPTSPICCRLSMAFHVATRPDFGSKMST